MRYVKLSNSQIEVSVIGLGTWAIDGKWWGGTDEKDSVEAIQASIDSGINFIDTAPAYSQGLSEKHNASYGHIMTAWLIKNPKVIALCGARNKNQAIENTLAGNIELDKDDIKKWRIS